MYTVTIKQRQGKNSEYTTTEKILIHGNFLELQLGDTTKFIALSGVDEITQKEMVDAEKPGTAATHRGKTA